MLFAGRAGLLAAICGTRSDGFDLHVWDWNTQRSQSFRLQDTDNISDQSGLIIDANRSRITLFNQENFTTISFHTYSMDGTVISSGAGEIRGRIEPEIYACDTEGNFVISSTNDETLCVHSLFQKVIVFDENSLLFTHRVYSGSYLRRTYYGSWFLWRDTVYAVENPVNHVQQGRLHVYNYELNPDVTNLEQMNATIFGRIPDDWSGVDFDLYKVYHHIVYKSPDDIPFPIPDVQIRGNDSFLQLIDHDKSRNRERCLRINTLCFEAGILPPEMDDFDLGNIVHEEKELYSPHSVDFKQLAILRILHPRAY